MCPPLFDRAWTVVEEEARSRGWSVFEEKTGSASHVLDSTVYTVWLRKDRTFI